MLRALLLGLAGLFLATGVAAAPDTRVANDGTSVTIPFDPGVGTVARYRMVSTETKTKAGKGEPPMVTRSTEQFRFLEANERGYVLERTSHDVRVEGPAEQTQLMQSIYDELGVVPIRVQLDRSGQALDVLNLAELNRTMDRVWALTIEKTVAAAKARGDKPEAIARMEATLGAMSATFRNMTSTVAVEQLLSDMSFAMGWGGTGFTMGESLPFRTTVPMQMLQAQVDYMGTVDLVDHVPGGHATLKIRASAEQRSLQAAVKDFSVKLHQMVMAQIPADKRAEVEKGLAAEMATLDRLRVEEETQFTLSLSTGLPMSGRYLMRRGVPGSADTEIKREFGPAS